MEIKIPTAILPGATEGEYRASDHCGVRHQYTQSPDILVVWQPILYNLDALQPASTSWSANGGIYPLPRQSFIMLKHFSITVVSIVRHVLIPGLFMLYCVVPSDTVQEKFYFEHAALPDTVAPFGSIIIAFTEPVSDSSPVGFSFQPSFYSYALIFNTARDSVIVQLSEPLRGNTTYTIRLQYTVYSINNSVFTPQSDSMRVVTGTVEQEPNNRVELADTLRQRCFGAIALVNDTDWYVVDKKIEELYLHSFGSQTTFALLGGGVVTTLREFTIYDTVTIPETAALPLYVAVYSYFRSVGGYYELGYTGTGR